MIIDCVMTFKQLSCLSTNQTKYLLYLNRFKKKFPKKWNKRKNFLPIKLSSTWWSFTAPISLFCCLFKIVNRDDDDDVVFYDLMFYDDDDDNNVSCKLHWSLCLWSWWWFSNFDFEFYTRERGKVFFFAKFFFYLLMITSSYNDDNVFSW